MLRRAVRSALAAVTDDGEILVIDDNSLQPAIETLADLNNPKLRIYKSTAISGVSGVRNFGMQKARGDVVFFLDDDDEIHPDYCSRILEEIKVSDTELDYGFSSYLEMTDTTLGMTKGPFKQGPIWFSDGIIPEHPFKRKSICGFGMGFWIRKSVFQEVGYLNENLELGEDTDYLCRLLKLKKKCWYSQKPGVTQHAHDGLSTQEINHISKRSSLAKHAMVFLYLAEAHPLYCQSMGFWYVKNCIRLGDFRAALRYSWRQPTPTLKLRYFAFGIGKFLAYSVRGKIQPATGG